MNWQNKNGSLTIEFSFKNQTALAEYVLKVAKYSDKVGHHADMKIHYNKLKLSVYTHDENCITAKDYDLIRELDNLKATSNDRF